MFLIVVAAHATDAGLHMPTEGIRGSFPLWSLGGPGGSLGAKEVSWGVEAGLVGPFGGVLEAPFSLCWEVNLHTVYWNIDVFHFGSFFDSFDGSWILLLFFVIFQVLVCETVRWIYYKYRVILTISKSVSSKSLVGNVTNMWFYEVNLEASDRRFWWKSPYYFDNFMFRLQACFWCRFCHGRSIATSKKAVSADT